MEKMSENLHSSSLYMDPSFLRGVARVQDLFGVMNDNDAYNTKKKPDHDALKRDWEIVGKDLTLAMEQYREEIEQNLASI